jgi:DNA-binding NarL/FixJ family response regulator
MKTEAVLPDVVIADIQILIVEGLKVLMDGKCILKACVNSRIELQEVLQNTVPRILIMDYTLLDFDGFDDLREMKKGHPSMEIVILTNHFSRNDLVEFNNAGIKNILHKNLDKDELYACLDAVLRGKKYYSSLILDMVLDLNEKKGNVDETIQLTASEIEIVRLIAEGLTTKEIACRKFISFHTVMTHRKNILRKLGVSNASELIMYAIKTGIIDTIEFHI